MEISDSIFSKNIVEIAACISLVNNVTFQISNSNFNGNTNGSLAAVNYAQGKILQCNFTNNTGEVAVAVYAGVFTNLTVENSYFLNNKAITSGTAIWGFAFTNIEIFGSVFTKNSAGKTGGAIYVIVDCAVLLVNSNFTNNSVQGNGGAIYFSADINANITECNFDSNQAGDEGMLITMSSKYFSAYFPKTTVEQNSMQTVLILRIPLMRALVEP